jgi:hypothetical protein
MSRPPHIYLFNNPNNRLFDDKNKHEGFYYLTLSIFCLLMSFGSKRNLYYHDCIDDDCNENSVQFFGIYVPSQQV